jgi:hypothetical protein
MAIVFYLFIFIPSTGYFHSNSFPEFCREPGP